MRIIPIMPIESMYGMVYQRAGYMARATVGAGGIEYIQGALVWGYFTG